MEKITVEKVAEELGVPDYTVRQNLKSGEWDVAKVNINNGKYSFEFSGKKLYERFGITRWYKPTAEETIDYDRLADKVADKVITKLLALFGGALNG